MKQLKSKQEILEELKKTVETTVHLLAKVSRSPKKKSVHTLRTSIKMLKAYTSFFLHMKCDASVVQEWTASLQDVYSLAGVARTMQLARGKKKADKLLLWSSYKRYKHILKKQKTRAKKKLSKWAQEYAAQVLRDWYEAMLQIVQAMPATTLTHHRKTYQQTCLANIYRLIHLPEPADDDIHAIRKYIKKMVALRSVLEQSSPIAEWQASSPSIQRKMIGERIGSFHDIVEHIILMNQILVNHKFSKIDMHILEEMKDSIKLSLIKELRSVLRA